jgi:hypothetical protein
MVNLSYNGAVKEIGRKIFSYESYQKERSTGTSLTLSIISRKTFSGDGSHSCGYGTTRSSLGRRLQLWTDAGGSHF